MKEFLSARGIKYSEYNVAEDREALKKMVEISGAKSVPVIAACGEVMIGFEPKRLERMLDCIKERSDGK